VDCLELFVFFYSVDKEIQRLFPIIFDRGESGTEKTKGGITGRSKKDVVRENSFWEIVAIQVAEKRIFDTKTRLGLDAVNNTRAYDVLRIFQLILTTM